MYFLNIDPENLFLKYFKTIIVCACGLLLLASCENDIEKINAITREPDYPIQTAFDARFIFTDSTKLETIVEAPEVNRFTFTDQPYYEFPKGFEIFLYDENENQQYQIKANYGKALIDEELWEARNDVVVLNLQTGEKLNTEQLFWDQQNNRIYSEKFTKITNEDGVFYGEQGFESNEAMTSWKLIGTTGTVNIDEEEN